jgi:hypothetical protein
LIPRDSGVGQRYLSQPHENVAKAGDRKAMIRASQIVQINTVQEEKKDAEGIGRIEDSPRICSNAVTRSEAAWDLGDILAPL